MSLCAPSPHDILLKFFSPENLKFSYIIHDKKGNHGNRSDAFAEH